MVGVVAETRTKRVFASLTAAQRAELEKVAAAENRSLAGVVTFAVVEYLRRARRRKGKA